jgi:hypothetical protein
MYCYTPIRTAVRSAASLSSAPGLLTLWLASIALAVPPALAQVPVSVTATSVVADGQFTVDGGILHSWSTSSGYNRYDTATGVTTNLGKPPNGVNSNGFGDAFGVWDGASSTFYAGTVNNASGGIYTYDGVLGQWTTPGPDGIEVVNVFGADTHDGELYVSGLAEPFTGTFGQSNFISRVDDAGRQDTIVETGESSALLAFAPNGDLYYTPFTNNVLYRWSAAQVAGVVDDLSGSSPTDTFLSLADGEQVLTLPGAGSGVAVDSEGNIFFTVNDFGAVSSTLGLVDPDAPEGYETLIATQGEGDFFGALSIDGAFEAGDPLYFSSGFGEPLDEVTLVPEPGAFALIVGAAAFGLFLAKRRKCA